MANTYTQLYIQFVFAVKGREQRIARDHKEDLHRYITGVVTNTGNKLLAVDCEPDHTHLFVGINPKVSASELARDVKANSSRWLKDQHSRLRDFAWQESFSAFSYGKSQRDTVIRYILNQEEHHRKRTFREEYIALLEAFEVVYDSRYLFEFYD